MIKTVTVIGANGAMGTNVSAIFASFGKAKVYMVSRNIEDSIKAAQKAASSVKSESIKKRLCPKTYNDLIDCIKESDLIFESVAENIDIKQSIYEQIKDYIQPHTIIASGTSGLSIKKLSQNLHLENQGNFFGIHMFNPPYKMTLCELIPTEISNDEIIFEMENYLTTVLRRTVVTLKDSPAFLGNRIGFHFINEAAQFAEQYKDMGGIDYLDGILGPFTGRQMAPLRTTDFVGLDVHKAIIENIYNNTNDEFQTSYILPQFLEELISDGSLGKKTGKGLYQIKMNNKNIKTTYVYDINSKKYRPIKKYEFPFAIQMKNEIKNGNYIKAKNILLESDSNESHICLQFLIRYVVYSIWMSNELGDNIHAGDNVMASGFNWIPPLAVISWFGGKSSFLDIVEKEMSKSYLIKYKVRNLLENTPNSKFDYRPFLKAK